MRSPFLLFCFASLAACPLLSPVTDGGLGGGTSQAGGGTGNGAGGGSACLTACPLLACGDLPDGCGAVLHCGGCPLGEACGGSGQPNVCAAGSCTPTSCEAEGKNCGQLSDGCGAILECGSCPNGQTCGAQTPNVCGAGTCTPKSCVELGTNCGTVSDGCDQTIACGTCAQNETCGATNVCQPSCPRGCPSGYTCDARGICSGGNPTFAIDLITHVVQGAITVNGVTPTVGAPSTPASPTLLVALFTDKESGARSASTVTCSGGVNQPCPASFEVPLFPGHYRVSVFASGIAELPSVPVSVGTQGVHVFEVLADYRVSGPATGLALNLVTVPTQLSFTINGASPLNTSMTTRLLTLIAEHTTTGQLTSLTATCLGGATGSACPLTATARLAPGTHHIVRLSNSSFPELPIGADVRLDTAFAVAAGQSAVVVDLTPFTVRGTLTFDGDAGVASTSVSSTTVAFTPIDGGSPLNTMVQCAPSGRCETSFSARIFPGAYRVDVRARSIAGFPANGTYVFSSNRALTTAAAPLAIDVPTVRLGGRVTINGLVPSRASTTALQTTLEIALVDLVDPVQRSTITVDCSDPMTACTGSFSEPVFRGRAAASIAGTNVTNLPPAPAASPPEPVDATSGRSGLVLDVRTTTLRGNVTVNGLPPTISAQATTGTLFAIRLVRPGGGAQSLVGAPCPSAVAQTSCPISFTTPVFQSATFTAEASARGFNELPFGATFQSWPLGRVFPLETPVSIGTSPAMVALDVKTVRLAGSVTVNGLTARRGGVPATAPASLQLTNRASGGTLSMALSCAATPAPPACSMTFDTVVPRGVYELAVVPQSLSGVSGGPSTRWVVADSIELR